MLFHLMYTTKITLYIYFFITEKTNVDIFRSNDKIVTQQRCDSVLNEEA